MSANAIMMLEYGQNVFVFSIRPREWLSIKVCYLLTDLRYIEYGLQSQVSLKPLKY